MPRPRKTTRYVDPEEVIRIVRETRLKAEAFAKRPEECLDGKCQHDECKPPRTKTKRFSGQRRPRDENPSIDNAIRGLEEFN